MAESAAEIAQQARDALASAVENMEANEGPLPPCVEEGAFIVDYDHPHFNGPRPWHVSVETSGEAVRINMTTKDDFLTHLDEIGWRTGMWRSELLARGARMLIAAERDA